MKTANFRLLSSDNNARGDLFTRLVKDLFYALGYSDLRLNVHKSGRELDLIGQHRFESRRVVAECKAHQEKIGGAELNKFFGVLARERNKESSVAGYFVSLSGFTETAIQQELDSGNNATVLIDGVRVVEELEKCNVIVDRAAAYERAGQCAQFNGLAGTQLSVIELLGHQRGYIWAVFYSTGKENTHFCLIHADGTPLAQSVANEIIASDSALEGNMAELCYLVPAPMKDSKFDIENRAVERYRKWLGEECGFIQLDGLPADSDLSATRLKLERLFVPLRAVEIRKSEKQSSEEVSRGEAKDLLIGKLLSQKSHLALLAIPGGGKSTLIKRLATAYAFPERRSEVDDCLPQNCWLPLILRCRELRTRTHLPVVQLLNDVAAHANMNAEELICFHDVIHSSLREGKALLLIDGLDEISDEGGRQVFASNLRTFIGMFPNNAVVITSREAGFRHIAGVISGVCEGYRIAPLNEADVNSLCERWHVEVVGDNAKVRQDSIELAQAIWGNFAIRSLAENPLLLTTLLIVKRSIGNLPRSRTALYREAIRVLVRTWNVEGYEPMDEDETLAQLSYVACSMMEDGKQQIGQTSLVKLLRAARLELEAELQFTKISPQEFTQRIEYRSSLLMQTGFERNENGLEPIYEFRHLTFQEYLAARGYVEEQYRGRDNGMSLADVLQPNFDNALWQEVVPLATVLAGRKAEEVIKRIIHKHESAIGSDKGEVEGENISAAMLLYKCIVDEVTLTTPTLRSALKIIAAEIESADVVTIAQSKFGNLLREILEEEVLRNPEELLPTLAEIEYAEMDSVADLLTPAFRMLLKEKLEKSDTIGKIYGALLCMNVAFTLGELLDKLSSEEADAAKLGWADVVPPLEEMIFANEEAAIQAASWALAWIGENRFISSLEKRTIIKLYLQWQSRSGAGTHFISWALAAQPLLPRNTFSQAEWGENCDEFLLRQVVISRHPTSTTAAVVVGWYRRRPWSDSELVSIIKGVLKASHVDTTLKDLLGNLGQEGAALLEELNDN